MGASASISRRLYALRRAVADNADERGAKAWTLFALYAAGTILGLAVLPFTAYLTAAELVTVLVTCALGVGVCAVIALAWRRLPEWAFPVLVGMGTLAITAGTYVASARPTESEMFYIWVGLYSAYFFSRRMAAAQVAFVGVAYAVALAAGHDTGNDVARWMLTMGSLVVTAALFGHIKELFDAQLAAKEHSEQELEALISLQRATLESTADGILVVDRDGHIVSFNQRFKQMWRIPDEILEIGGAQRTLNYVCDQLRDPEAFVRKVEQLHARPEAESYDLLQFTDDRVFERYSRPQRGLEGQIHGRVWSFRDVTERERIQARLRHLADHDPLTGLLNRRRFEEELAGRVAHVARYDSGGAVLLLDLDDFKRVNDSLGHRTGDAVIRSVADLLRAQLRETDVIARLGGDEFAVLLPHAAQEQAERVARKLLYTLRRHRVVFREQRLQLSTSIGVAVISDARVQTAEEVMVEADVAVYDAKEAGRDGYCVYAAGGDRQSGTDASLAWLERIREAIDGDRLMLHAQPVLDLSTNGVSQYELLVRMIGPDGEILPPHRFLPTAERAGMIQEIDLWVTRSAIRLLNRLHGGGRHVRLEVNLSGRTLGDRSLPRTIRDELAAASFDPGSLIFEVTETAAVLNMEDARIFATELVGMGCRFALDDFGAGFGSFHYLKHLPLEYLKIDGDFIGDLASSVTDQAMVQAIVDLSRRLDKVTIAEFVSDQRTVELLREYGVGYAQGYHIGPPQPIAELWGEPVLGPASPPPPVARLAPQASV
jgi:diguanylate cyclase (GGDEF)-like protein